MSRRLRHRRKKLSTQRDSGDGKNPAPKWDAGFFLQVVRFVVFLIMWFHNA